MRPVLADPCGEGLRISQEDPRSNHCALDSQLLRKAFIRSVDPRLDQRSSLRVVRTHHEIIFPVLRVRIDHAERGYALGHGLHLMEGLLDGLGQHGFPCDPKVAG